MRAVLLYGAPQTGKSALVRAVAAQAGAGLFDLSPRATDGKYPGKAAALMVHMARARPQPLSHSGREYQPRVIVFLRRMEVLCRGVLSIGECMAERLTSAEVRQ